jgi:Na+/melibiose symporter-like transporter
MDAPLSEAEKKQKNTETFIIVFLIILFIWTLSGFWQGALENLFYNTLHINKEDTMSTLTLAIGLTIGVIVVAVGIPFIRKGLERGFL